MTSGVRDSSMLNIKKEKSCQEIVQKYAWIPRDVLKTQWPRIQLLFEWQYILNDNSKVQSMLSVTEYKRSLRHVVYSQIVHYLVDKKRCETNLYINI